MRNSIIIAVGIVLVISGIAIIFTPPREPVRRARFITDKKHNVIVRFNGTDAEIPEDGQLLIIKCSLEDTVVVEPASLDDCRRILEENGQG